MATARFESYAAFWPHYLREHARGGTRALHFLGTGLALVLVDAGLVTGIWWLFPAAVVSGYLFAWIGHLTVERNRPATFTHPLWSLISDFRMFFLWLTGRLWRELKKAEVTEPLYHAKK